MRARLKGRTKAAASLTPEAAGVLPRHIASRPTWNGPQCGLVSATKRSVSLPDSSKVSVIIRLAARQRRRINESGRDIVHGRQLFADNAALPA